MSISLKVDGNNNILAGSSFLTVSGNSALAQDIKNILSMWQGEYPFNTEEGINYKNFIQGQDKRSLFAEIISKVREDERVQEVTLEHSRNGTGLQINMKTISGAYVTAEIG